MKINIIAAVAANGAIGRGNQLIYHLPDDMKRFKALTTGNTVLMGRKTYESLPKGALPNRRNIVVSRTLAEIPGCDVYPSIEKALEACQPDEHIYIIGGASIYEAALPLANRLCLTEIHDTPADADTFFPEYKGLWHEMSREEHPADERHAVAFDFVDYGRKIVVAIDGHSSCGKSTMAKALAKKIGYVYVDTGAMYRAVTLFALRNSMIADDGTIDEAALQKALPQVEIGFRFNPEAGKSETLLNGENVEGEIRGMEVSSRVSAISALPFVREALVEQQQAMGKTKGIVMDGRDIGTTVFPDAELKVFVTASEEVRAQRRFDEMKAKGQNPVFEEVLENVRQRDYTDSHREVSPLRQAPDALVLDNSNMTFDEQDAWLLNAVKKAMENDR